MGNVATSKTRKGIALTHRSLEVLKPAAVAYRVPDLRCPGLAVRVAPSGLKTWDAAFRIRGTNSVRRKSLGAFPAVGLDEARERANALIRAAQTGRDVIGEEAKAKAEADARLTVTGLIDVYIKRRAKGLRTKHEIELRLRRALAPLRNRYVEELRRRDIRALLDATVDRGAEREAEKRKQSIAAMFKWALAQDLVEDDPTRGLGTYSTGKLRDRILSADEIQVLWGWIGNADLTEDIADSLRLQLCTGCRIGEASGIEVEEIDTDAWVWTLPAGRSKNKKARRTPIVGLAREIVEARLKYTRSGALFLCETGRSLRSNDVGSAIVTRRKRIPLDHFVTHDLRRTVATELVEMGIAPDLVAAVLGHEAGDRNTRILARHYVRTDLIERKRVALEAWDARLRAIIAGQGARQNIVQLADVMRKDLVS